MISLSKVPIHLFVSPERLHHTLIPFNLFGSNSRSNNQKLMSLHFVGAKGTVLGFVELKRNCGGFGMRCKKDWESGGDLALEAEILEFMKSSKKTEAFPSKKDLVEAGRRDLVEAISKQGGWLALGWDLDDDDNNANESVSAFSHGVFDLDYERDKDFKNDIQETVLERNKEKSLGGGSYAPAASSSGRSLETEAEDKFGIEGILSRLEKERNTNFGFGSNEKKGNARVQRNIFSDKLQTKHSKNVTLAGLEKKIRSVSSSVSSDIMNDPVDEFGNSRSPSNVDDFRCSLEPDVWRKLSAERAGSSEMDFEADEFIFRETRTGGKMDTVRADILENGRAAPASLSTWQENSSNEIQSRLQQLDLELSSVVNTLKSNTGESMVQKKGSPDELVGLSDAWEFQEDEIMKSHDMLRSIQAKLAVLEGKMSLAMLGSKKIVEEKQKRIDDAQKALQLLRTVLIGWTNLASEVLVTGSFDGWASKRKMHKSSSGMFSVRLKLYPGTYEIKFIVDGEWKVDPLRPIICNDGYENNVLIVT